MALKIIRRDILVGAAASAALTTSINSGLANTATTHEIKIKSFEFVPQHIAVKVGDTITWINEDIAPHTATAIKASWDTGEIIKDEARSIVVFDDMETSYYCVFHPHMKGTIELV